jgi:Zn-dependent protease
LALLEQYIAPAAAQFYGYDSGRGPLDPEEDNMIISAAGPGINLAFALGFLVMLFLVPPGFLSTVAIYGLLLNVGLGSFNMLPVSRLDGAKIFRKSIPLGLGMAIPLWAMFIIFNFIL